MRLPSCGPKPLKCWTYLLPELTVKESEVTRTMEEAILRAEKSMRKRKALPDEGGDKRSLAIAKDMVVDLLSESDAEQPTLPGGVFTCISIFPKIKYSILKYRVLFLVILFKATSRIQLVSFSQCSTSIKSSNLADDEAARKRAAKKAEKEAKKQEEKEKKREASGNQEKGEC